jgi:hypothetical protein
MLFSHNDNDVLQEAKEQIKTPKLGREVNSCPGISQDSLAGGA